MSTSWLLDAEPNPRILVLPPGDVDLGEADAAIELWEHYSRKTLDPSQRLVVQVLMAQVDGGRWAAATTGREMPRQNGKGDEIEVVELWGLVQRAEAILHTVHDAVLLATQTQQRMLGVLEGHADLRRLVKRKWQGTGQQMIELRNGGVIWYRTRTSGGGRGVDDIDRLVVDEAQHATEEHLAAVSPTLMANPNPQLNAMGTAGLSGTSGWWWRLRRRALDASPGSFGYVGHTAERVSVDDDGRVVQEPVDVEDRGLWPAANPALSSGRGGGMDFLEEQLRRLGPAPFAREHLGVWDPPDDEARTAAVIAAEAWAGLADVEAVRPSPVALAVAAAPDRHWVYLCLAGRRSDGGAHLQVVETLKGSADVPARVAELVAKWNPVGVATVAASAAAPLVPDIEAYKPARGRPVEVRMLSQRDMAKACGMLLDSIDAGTLHHAGGDLLAISVGAARRRKIGDGDLWMWGSDDDSTHIAPLEGVTAALYVLVTSNARRESKAGKVVVLR